MNHRLAYRLCLPVLAGLLLTACNEPEAYNGSSSFQSTPSKQSSQSTQVQSNTSSASTSASKSQISEAGKSYSW